MTRDEMRAFARKAALTHAPGIAMDAIERIVESPILHRWFDHIERTRPRGLVARFRSGKGLLYALFGGRKPGLSESEREAVSEFVRSEVEKMR